MEENMIVNGQEIVEKAAEELVEKAANLDTAVAVTNVQKAVSAPAKNYTGKNIAIGAGLVLGGGAIGFAFDHWVVPKITEALENHRVKKAEKKAAKEAKKAAKKADKKQTAKPAPAPAKAEEPEPDDQGIDPTTVETTIN